MRHIYLRQINISIILHYVFYCEMTFTVPDVNVSRVNTALNRCKES